MNEENRENFEREENITPEVNEENIIEASEAKETEVAETSKKKKEKKKKSVGKEILDWVLSIAVALLVVTVVNMFFFVQVKVDGRSMVPTLADGDRLFASRFMYSPKQGDIVVVEPFLKDGTVKGKLMIGRTLYIKRVIAVEGQTIDIRNNKVYIDGHLYKEPYIPSEFVTVDGTTKTPLVVPEGHVFVMGDNRSHSSDSRDKAVGLIREEQIVGKAVLRIWPLSEFGVVK